MHAKIKRILTLLTVVVVLTLCLCRSVDASAISRHSKRSFNWQNQASYQHDDDDIDWSALDQAGQSSPTSSGSGGSGQPSSNNNVAEFLQQHYPDQYDEYRNAKLMATHPKSTRAIQLQQQNHRRLADIRQRWKADNHPAYQVMLNQDKRKRQRYKASASSWTTLCAQEKEGSISDAGQKQLDQMRMKHAINQRKSKSRLSGQGGRSG